MKPASGSLVPDNSAPRAVASPGRSHSAGGEAQPALDILLNQNVRTTSDSLAIHAGNAGFPHPASPHHSVVSAAVAGATYRSIRVTDLNRGRTRGTSETFVLPAKNIRGSWITFVG